MNRHFSRTPSNRSGFTLLELVLAIGLLAILVGMVMSVATQNIALGRAVVDRQNEVSVETAFFEMLSRQFSQLPGNTRMELVSQDSGAQYLSDLTLQNVPSTFTWGGGEQVAKAIQLSTVRRRDGLLDIVLRYYENPILEETTEEDETALPGDDEPFAEIVLLEDVYIFEWEVLDGRTMEWGYDWDLEGRLPLQMKLTFMASSVSEPITHIFWVTPKQNPEVVMRQLQQTQSRDNNVVR
ncbi:prepilin-type N-terminal cleavage/methylation domain-containing protein [Haloferula luteola]|uniref:Prepilin-type N-terminal cleavage/methylation domain-containing protein n=1 Tax=Haloferula luteola TaxID=595692 RepID=A0A840V9J3_9BACT|nr:type II secretion system protein [Haloferula luteola]MBB5352254.1 prepilin-type N-terminal cleavage/methylation domain-containing protein [Haloferula luteola]